MMGDLLKVESLELSNPVSRKFQCGSKEVCSGSPSHRRFSAVFAVTKELRNRLNGFLI
jgi:hypothetical protein